MKITDIKMHVFNKKIPVCVTSTRGYFRDSGPAGKIEFSLVRILTDEGIEGDFIAWSEIPAASSLALAQVLRAWKPHILNKNPLDREQIWQELGDFWYRQRGPALAAIDIALWDIAGKAANLPVYKLLGAYRERVLAYASGGAKDTPQANAEFAVELKERGYKAMKIHPVDIKACRAIRKAVGESIILMHDPIFSYSRQQALSVGKELEKLNFYWFEAPLPLDDINGYVKLTQQLEIPVTVEIFNNYLEYIQKGAVDIFRSMCGFTGGITELRKVATLCEYFGMQLEPHSFGGIFYQMAHLHVILSIKNCNFFELPISQEDGEEGYFDVGIQGNGIRIDKEGYVHAPQGPGLGLTIDWDQVKQGEEVDI